MITVCMGYPPFTAAVAISLRFKAFNSASVSERRSISPSRSSSTATCSGALPQAWFKIW